MRSCWVTSCTWFLKLFSCLKFAENKFQLYTCILLISYSKIFHRKFPKLQTSHNSFHLCLPHQVRLMAIILHMAIKPLPYITITLEYNWNGEQPCCTMPLWHLVLKFSNKVFHKLLFIVFLLLLTLKYFGSCKLCRFCIYLCIDMRVESSIPVLDQRMRYFNRSFTFYVSRFSMWTSPSASHRLLHLVWCLISYFVFLYDCSLLPGKFLWVEP